jgi:hypothetical protein
MDRKSVAEGLVQAVGELSYSERARLRRITDLAPDEIKVLTGALAHQSSVLAELVLKLIKTWDQLEESVRVASLLAVREILVRELLEGRPLEPRR